MKVETALGEKLRLGGFVPREVRLSMAIAEFLNNGGTIERAHELVAVAADKMESEGQTRSASNGRGAASDTLRPNAEAGRRGVADKANVDIPASADRKKPGHAKRGALQIRSVQAALSRSLFDTISLPDGRKLREVKWSECPNLAVKYRRLSRIFMAVHGHGVPADPNTTVDNVVTEEGLNEIVSAVDRFNDIH